MTQQIAKRVSHAMWQADGEPEHCGVTTVGREHYERQVGDVMKALDDLGFVVVPRQRLSLPATA